MKGLYPATYHALEDIVINGNWSNYAGKIDTLGLVSSEDIEKNYVGLPLESTQWEEGKCTLNDYKVLVAKLYSGELKVDSDISKMPTTKKVKVIYLGNIK
jgi:basic membrane protein A